ncbi:HCL226Cp [Eremothecium sinecaudum]|uniref:HCL226Cp n=1 Tax=Eremothecium sinecaudum TaxID=45286 RepID=A0A0X8HR61_9SACH|nr:HCL226Cp [Eremothecium sinecaudum]AMD19925.1 HCL226Cp [Eremothecium sinecaudum]
MSPKVTIELNPPVNGSYYTDYEEIAGRVVLSLSRPASVKRLNVSLRGLSQTRTILGTDGRYQYTQSAAGGGTIYDGDHSTHVVYHREVQLFPPTGKIDDSDDDGVSLAKGSYGYDFAFKLLGSPDCVQKRNCKGESLRDEQPKASLCQLPPSFNDKNDGKAVDRAELVYYALGRVRYKVNAQLEMGGDRKLFGTSKKNVTASSLISFMPNVCRQQPQDDTVGPEFRFQSLDSVKLAHGLHMNFYVISAKPLTVHRMDYLFRRGCGKFDDMYLMFDKSPAAHSLKAKRLQLFLNEETTYAVGKRSDRNDSSLLLMSTDLNQEIPLGEDHVLRMDLSKNSALNRLRFNEEDYVHRGNRLYSFNSCNISREFEFKLVIHWVVDGKRSCKSEVAIPVTVLVDDLWANSLPPPYE